MIMACLDMVGVASILPFMGVLSNPTVLDTNIYLHKAFLISGLGDTQSFLFLLGFGVFLSLVLSITFKAYVTWALLRFTYLLHYSLANKLTEGYLNQPYEFYLNRHSADLGKTVLTEVGQVISGALVPMMDLFVNASVGLALVILLFLVNPMLTLSMCGGLGISYGMIFFFLRKYLARIGAERVVANKARFQALSEAFGGIKEVKVSGLEDAFFRRFDKPSRHYAITQVNAQISFQIPKFILELLAFGGMILLLLYLMQDSQSLQSALPLISVYAFAAYRLMPALRDLFANLSKLRFAGPALKTLHTDFTNLKPSLSRRQDDVKISFKNAIRLEHIHYRYPLSSMEALRDLSIEIPVRSTVGFIGESGSGKTTTVDLILGLLKAESGQMKVDDLVINSENCHAWQRIVGYVPQHIFLSDDTIEANIAFGVRKEDIDQEAVVRAAKIARLHEFVTEKLPQLYMTSVGERGIRLSGGQRQRIGIARALYHQPQVLVLDEATSALDNLTEHEVMEAVYALSGEITIILIAHRLSTVSNCDRLYLFEGGQVIRTGSYQEIVEQKNS